MLNRSRLIAVWLAWLVVCGITFTGLSKARSIREQYAELLHSFMHRPVAKTKPAAMPNHIHQQQQLMLEAMQRQQHDDLHRMLQQREQQEQPVAGAQGRRQTTAVPDTGQISNASRADILHNLHAAWPEGYVAICAVVKDQNRDLRYWVEYHRWLGVSKFYIFDNNSTLPAMMVLWDYIKQGLVDYQYFIGRPRRLPDFRDTNQYKAYHGCLLQHFKQHRWLAFIDIDEFLVFPPPNAAAMAAEALASSQSKVGTRDLLDKESSSIEDDKQMQAVGASVAAVQPGMEGRGHPASSRTLLQQDQSSSSNNMDDDTQAPHPPEPVGMRGHSKENLAVFLSRYEQHAALGINWVLFGSSGLQERPREGPLAAYTSCVSQQHWESTHVKVIANTGGILGVGHTPHEVVPRAGRHVVDVDGVEVKGPKTPTSKWHKLVIHHYVLKSRSEFAAKKARGSGAGNVKEWSFFNYMDALSNWTCTWGQPVSRAFFASRPSLRPPKGAQSICGIRNRMQVEATAAAGRDVAGMVLQEAQTQQPLQRRKQQGEDDDGVQVDDAADYNYDQ